MYDYFEPAPPIPCPHCGATMEGWQGKHWGDCCFFVWRQGEISPVDHRVDPDVRLDEIGLASRRLEKDCIPIYGGKCKNCGASWRNSQFLVSVDAQSGVWTRTFINPEPFVGTLLEGGWIQCPLCADAYPIGARQMWVICEPCARLVRKPEV